ncbi:hypothetical protein, partial [Streptomyces mirabilis]|uniref:hypothetical protein n=1 Tax=Streptomyces mirabilis TaxID=68239 RepID=UPI0036D9C8BD
DTMSHHSHAAAASTPEQRKRRSHARKDNSYSLTTPVATQRAMNPQTSAIGTPDLNGCSFG